MCLVPGKQATATVEITETLGYWLEREMSLSSEQKLLIPEVLLFFLGVNSGFSDHRLSRRFLKPWRFDSLRDI